VQMLPKVGLNLLGDGAFQSWAPSVNGLINGIGNAIVGKTGEEDVSVLVISAQTNAMQCLFLDVTVPGKALKEKSKLPVANWIYGGAVSQALYFKQI
jgi:Carboxylesterase family